MTEYVENQFNCFLYKTEIHNARKTFNFFIKLSINFLGRFLRRTNHIQKTPPKLISNKKNMNCCMYKALPVLSSDCLLLLR